MNKVGMLNAMIEYYGNGSQSQFARLIGVVPQRVNQWIHRESFDSELLFKMLDNISPAWLLSGEGDMTLKDQDRQLLPVQVQKESGQAISKAKAKVVVEFELDEDEFVKLGLSDKVIRVLKNR